MMNFSVAALGSASIMGRGRPATEAEHIDHPLLQSIPYLKLTIIGLLQFLGNFATSILVYVPSFQFDHPSLML